MTPRAAKPNSDASAEAAFSFAPQVGLMGAFGPLLVTQSAQGALTALDAFESALQMWREAIDGSRMALRDQQDSILRTWREQLTGAVGERAETESQSAVLWPVATAAQSYAQMGAAFIKAQRETLEAMSRSASLH